MEQTLGLPVDQHGPVPGTPSFAHVISVVWISEENVLLWLNSPSEGKRGGEPRAGHSLRQLADHPSGYALKQSERASGSSVFASQPPRKLASYVFVGQGASQKAEPDGESESWASGGVEPLIGVVIRRRWPPVEWLIGASGAPREINSSASRRPSRFVRPGGSKSSIQKTHLAGVNG